MKRRASAIRALAGLALASGGPALAADLAGQRSFVVQAAGAAALLERMTLAEKLGQMTQADLAALAGEREGDVAALFLGSVLAGGDSDPPTNSLADWRRVVERLQTRARGTRLGIPILFGVDAVHGHSNVVGATIFPHAIGLGAADDAELVEAIARATAVEMRASGVDWAFAPGVMVPRDVRWGRTYEGFSEDPARVARLGAAMVRGFQAALGPESVLACAKHFVGDGGTAWESGHADPEVAGGRYPLDRGDTRLSEAELRRLHLAPYAAAVEAGVGSIMVSFSSWNGVKCSASHRLLTEILKRELGFEGFLVSDWDALDELPGEPVERVSAAVNAGLDMFMVPQRYREFLLALEQAVASGRVPMARIDDAVTRILRVKLAMGLMDGPRSAAPELAERLGGRAHRELARRAVRESLVLLRNVGHRLPLAPRLRRIHVAGRAADDLGMQCGGWTITWQGGRGPTTAGTTIREAIARRAPRGTAVSYGADGDGAAGADVAVVVVGETPYAEFHGDRRDLDLDPQDTGTLRAVRAAGVPVVMVLVSGRPMILEPILTDVDAIVAAWLPGSAGEGVADVLFGDFAPRGRLPHSWPRAATRLPQHAGEPGYAPLFPLGFGLGY